MSYQVFARKYRPQDFDAVVGQEHVTRTLKNAVAQGRLAHAYLFVGPRGTGKTSTARILARSLNCVQGPTVTPCGKCPACVEIAAGRSLDVLEFDAASNTQVDKVREIIIDNVQYAPASGRYKMYIVDEVHMLSTSSFNALLKTLEEPPPHVIFVFATTEVNRVPLTILSRCQRFDLRRIPAPLIARHLAAIADLEKIDLAPAAAEAIARNAEGGMRDAESMLDQLVAFCGGRILPEDVLAVFGFTSQETVLALGDRLLAGDCPGALEVVHREADAGKDLSQLLAELIGHLRNLLVAKADPGGLGEELTADNLARATAQAARIDLERLLALIDLFSAAEGRMRWAPNKLLHLEIALIRGVQTLEQATLTEVIDTLTALREGGPAPAAAMPAVAAAVGAGARPAASGTARGATAAAPAGRSPAAAAGAARAQSPAGAESADAPAVVTPPAPAPVPAEAAAAREAVDLDRLWADLLARMQEQRPLIATWLEKGRLLECAGGRCTIGFPAAERLALESVAKPGQRDFLQALVGEVVGGRVELAIESRADLPAVAPAAGVGKAVANGGGDAPADDPLADPLIAAAIEAFEAEIERNPPPAAAKDKK